MVKEKEIPAVVLKEVSKAFQQRNGRLLPVLTDVNLQIAHGEFVTLLGPSGCGKSTLLRLLAGLDTPTAGEISVFGSPVRGPHPERGLVFQDPTLFPWLTVSQNVALGPTARGLGVRREEVLQFLERVGLADFASAFPHQLSGGMAQRAALARVLINHPRVLLLDEPFGALGAFTRMDMQNLLRSLVAGEEITTVLVTHDVDEALFLSDRIVVLTPRPGRIRAIMPVSLPHPRDRSAPAFLKLRGELLRLFAQAQEAEREGKAGRLTNAAG